MSARGVLPVAAGIALAVALAGPAHAQQALAQGLLLTLGGQPRLVARP